MAISYWLLPIAIVPSRGSPIAIVYSGCALQASPMQMHCVQHQQIPTSPGGGSSSDKIVHAQIAAQNVDDLHRSIAVQPKKGQ